MRHAEKSAKAIKQAVSNYLSTQQGSLEATSQHMDNRPEAVVQSRLQAGIDNRPQLKALEAVQELANHSPQAVKTAQLQSMIDRRMDRQAARGKENSIQVESGSRSVRENHNGLPEHLKAGIEYLSGYAMDDVRVHYNSGLPAQLNAHAFAQGPHIHLATGQEMHLPHEAWHVVQQKQGRVKPTMLAAGKTPVNDTPGLEREADVMGNQALQGSVADPQKPLAQSSLPSPVVQRVIKTAGIELEMKGAEIQKQTGEDFGKTEKVIDKGNWWIVVDAQSPEFVTKPAATETQLFEWLRSGNELLNQIQDIGLKRTEFNALSEADNEYWPLWDEISTAYGEIGLSPDDIYIDANREEKYYYLAKPQISFGIVQGKLKEFTFYAVNEKIKYSSGYSKEGKEYKNELWPRINEKVREIWQKGSIWRTDKGKEFLAELNKLLSAAERNEAAGLLMLTVLQSLFATRKQDPANDWEYYKAKFSIMPRVSMSKLHDQMSAESKEIYKRLINLWYEAILENNKGKAENHPDYFSTRIYDAKKVNFFELSDQLWSIYDPAARHEKTVKRQGIGGEEERKESVDLISSDKATLQSDTGDSVGALELPANSEGIFELRALPYIYIQNFESVRRLFKETIDQYGGMPK